MKQKYFFTVFFALPLFFSGCCIEKYCEAFNEQHIKFAPLDLEKDDVLIYQSNYGNVSEFQVTRKDMSEAYEYETCSGGCTQYLIMIFACTNQQFKQMTLNLYYDDNKPKRVASTIIFDRQYHSFIYHTDSNGKVMGSFINENNESEAFSLPVVDSMLINQTWYYDIIELKDSVQTIHVAKSWGIVQITEKNGEIWTLN
ncbi:MAG: hypothetical protein LBV47_03530 [Bacteroidales bacterium]|jgi:hypothetical protein|nr:hypothetical protein [Bacteroidales bacterium]